MSLTARQSECCSRTDNSRWLSCLLTLVFCRSPVSGFCPEKTPEKHILTIPKTIPSEYRVNTTYNSTRNKVVIVTSRPYNVSVSVIYSVYSSANETILQEGWYVLNKSSSPLAVLLESNQTSIPETVTVISDDDVDVYIDSVNQEPNSNFTMVRQMALIPVSEFDTHFMLTLSHTILDSELMRKPFFMITAVNDNTQVSVLVPGNIRTHFTVVDSTEKVKSSDDEIYQKVLQAREVLRAWSPFDLTGVSITSDKPVSVTVGFRATSPASAVCCWSHPWALLPPVPRWGRDYVTFPSTSLTVGSSSSSSSHFKTVYFVQTSHPNTRLYYDGGSYYFPQDSTSLSTTQQDTSFGHILGGHPFQTLVIPGQQTGHISPQQMCLLALAASENWFTTSIFPVADTSTWTAETFRWDFEHV